MRYSYALRLALCVTTASALLAAALPSAHAATVTPAKSSGEKKKSGSGKTKVTENNSGETQAERDKRLYRECQGLPNAGACAGYTRR